MQYVYHIVRFCVAVSVHLSATGHRGPPSLSYSATTSTDVHAPVTCVYNSLMYNTCAFSVWTAWDCSSCPSYCSLFPGSRARRTRQLCCSITIPTALPNCFRTCGYVYGKDNIDYKDCVITCGCVHTLPSVKTMTSTSSTSAQNAFRSEAQFTAACDWSGWQAWDCSTCCSRDLIIARSRDLITARSRMLCCSGTFYPSDYSQCYRSCNKRGLGADEYSTCSVVCNCPMAAVTSGAESTTKQQASDTGNFSSCDWSSSKNLYMTICRAFAVSLFILGLLVGTLVTCFISWLMTSRRRHSTSTSVYPQCTGSSVPSQTSEQNDVGDVNTDENCGGLTYQTPKMVYDSPKLTSINC